MGSWGGVVHEDGLRAMSHSRIEAWVVWASPVDLFPEASQAMGRSTLPLAAPVSA